MNNHEPVNTLNASLLLIFSFILALAFLFLLFRSYLFDLVIDDMIAWNPISFYCFSQAWSLADGMLRLSKRCVHFPWCFFYQSGDIADRNLHFYSMLFRASSLSCILSHVIRAI